MKKSIQSQWAKMGTSYLIGEVFVNGLVFITTPIFTRLMSKTDFGMFNTFASLELILFQLVTLGMTGTVNKSKYAFDEDNESYIFSCVLFGNVLTILCYILFEVTKDFWAGILNLPVIYIRILFLYMLFYPAFIYKQNQLAIYKKYKPYVSVSVTLATLKTLASVLLVLFFHDKMLGRTLGYAIPSIIVCGCIYISILFHANRPRVAYMKYAAKMGAAILPTALSSVALMYSDRLMIASICGNEDVALYSVIYSVAMIVRVVMVAFNQVWMPWNYDHLQKNEYAKVRETTNHFADTIMLLFVGCLLFSPEIVWIMGGKKYFEVVSYLPPVMLGFFCEFIYNRYYSIAYFYGKVQYMIIPVVISAIVNVVLNAVFIGKYGCSVAVYTTFIGFAVMWILSYLAVKFLLKKSFIVDGKRFLLLSILLLIVSVGISQIFSLRWLRMGLAVLVAIIGLKSVKRLLEAMEG